MPYLWMRKTILNMNCIVLRGCHDQAIYYWRLFLDFLILDYVASCRGWFILWISIQGSHSFWKGWVLENVSLCLCCCAEIFQTWSMVLQWLQFFLAYIYMLHFLYNLIGLLLIALTVLPFSKCISSFDFVYYWNTGIFYIKHLWD